MKIIATLAAMLLATSAYADKVKIVNPGSEEGVFRQVLTDIGEIVPGEFIQASTPQVASIHLNGSVLTVWASDWAADADIKSPKVAEDNIVALMTYETILCTRSGKLDDVTKIATWGSDSVKKFLAEQGKADGVTYKIVPYSGSGSMTKGFIAGDADAIFTIESRREAVEQAGGKCIMSSADGNLNYRFVDAILVINADPVPYKKAVKKLNVAWADKFKGQKIYTDGNMLGIYDNAVKQFK